MLMIFSGVITHELCPNCDNPYPVEVRHGHDENGNRMHDYDCEECGGFMSLVGYGCENCDAVENPSPLDSFLRARRNHVIQI